MPTPTLFPLDDPLGADPSRPDPVLWIERLVILSERDPTAVVREVTFRRGLNIIQTTPSAPGDGRVAGHSVGKTLLVRLIRYSLGEQHFGSDDTELRVRRKFPNAHVAAIWHVAGAEWTVVRPLASGSTSDSRALPGRDWVAAYESKEAAYRTFLEAVEEATIGDLPELTLGRERSPRWLDVLGWLARDYQCGYRNSNEWRHSDANVGSGLDRDDNALVMQWVAGLLSDDEIRLRDAHRQLLHDRSDARSRSETEGRRADALKPALWEKLGIEASQASAGGEAPLIDPNPIRVAEEKIESLRRLRAERIAASSYETLHQQRQEAEVALIETKATFKAAENALSETKASLLQLDDANAPRPYQVPNSYENCEAKQCWMKQQEALQSGVDPAKEHHRQVLQQELAGRKNRVAEVKQSVVDAQAQYDNTVSALAEERERLASEVQGIDGDIVRWEVYEADAESYQQAASTSTSQAELAKSLDKQVDASLQRLGDLRQSQQSVLNRFSAAYRQVLRLVFGTDADGAIRVDGNGLRPAPSDRLAPEGAALSVMTAVLAFDLSAVASSMAGIGQHPRFLIHDSPREADMEGQLFGRVFEVAHHLEQVRNEETPNFQYIVTTTTQPPSAYASPDGTYVRLTLDALTEGNRLLGVAF